MPGQYLIGVGPSTYYRHYIATLHTIKNILTHLKISRTTTTFRPETSQSAHFEGACAVVRCLRGARKSRGGMGIREHGSAARAWKDAHKGAVRTRAGAPLLRSASPRLCLGAGCTKPAPGSARGSPGRRPRGAKPTAHGGLC